VNLTVGHDAQLGSYGHNPTSGEQEYTNCYTVHCPCLTGLPCYPTWCHMPLVLLGNTLQWRLRIRRSGNARRPAARCQAVFSAYVEMHGNDKVVLENFMEMII